jgi:putative ABC transport system permease protein
MEIIESFYLAWRAIRGHRLRSALTTLGVVIGVAAVILFVTLGTSLQAGIVREIRGEQEPSLSVIAAPEDAGLLAVLQGGSPVFTESDVKRIRAIPGVTAVHPHDPIITGGIATQTITYSDTFDPPPAIRTFFFPLNRTIRFDSREVNVRLPSNTSIPATVSGRIDITSTNGRVRISVIAHFAPTTGQLRSTDQHRYSRLTVEAASYQQLPEVRHRTKRFLQTSSDARRYMPESYEFVVLSNEQLVKRVNDIVGTITSYIVGVALISWLVGSIGIVNIIIVSVTERTKSIGIMKAVGAKNRDVLQIFLVEAIILGVAGAALGTLVGGLGGMIATWWLDLPLVFRLRWVGFAVLSGIVVGAIAGVYPAWRAARTDPIEALRYG